MSSWQSVGWNKQDSAACYHLTHDINSSTPSFNLIACEHYVKQPVVIQVHCNDDTDQGENGACILHIKFQVKKVIK